MLILDTDVLSILQMGGGTGYSHLATRLPVGSSLPVVVTIISFEEQARGWLAQAAQARSTEELVKAYHRLHRLLRYFAHQQIMDFDRLAADRYRELTKARIRIGAMDLKIAAIALAHDALLISRNLKDFRKVPGLKVEDWTIP